MSNEQNKLQQALAAKKAEEAKAQDAARVQATQETAKVETAKVEKKVPSYKIIKANRIANAAGYLLKPNNQGFYTPKDQEEFELLEYFCTTGHLEKV